MSKKHPIVEMRKLSKSFGVVKALDQVDLTVYDSEIVGLVGDNGAGKTTLMKILAGVYPPDKGEIFWCGKKTDFSNPSEARQLGIEVVYQDLALARNVDAVANVFTGRELVKPDFWGSALKLIDKEREKTETEKILTQLGIELPSVRTPVKYLSGGEQQMVAIARAVYSKPHVLIMDEPTTAIAVKERKRLLSLIPKFKERAISTIFISHTLQEVFTVADRVVVLSRGHKVGEGSSEEMNIEKVMELMMK